MSEMKLKRCPFCGIKPDMITPELNGAVVSFVECPNCRALVNFLMSESTEETVKMWNTRRFEQLEDIRVEKRARTIPSPNNDIYDGTCSLCKKWVSVTDNYCANCGAKFEKECDKK